MVSDLRIKKLTLENFGPFFGEHQIRFPSGTTFILAENKDGRGKLSSNGSGKTTLLYGICYALFGKTPTGLMASDLVHRGCTQLKARLDLGEGYIIERVYQKSKESVSFTNPVDGVFKADKKIAQARIEELLGITYNLFFASLYLSRTAAAVQFLQAQPAKRADILNDLVDTRVFTQARALVAKEYDKINEGWRSRDGVLSYQRAQIERWQQHIQSIDERLEAVEDTERKRKSALREQLAELQEKIDLCTATILTKPRHTMQQLEDDRLVLLNKRRVLEEAIQSLPLQHRHLSVGNCPACGQEVSHERVEEQERLRKVAAEDRARLRQEMDVLDRDIERVRQSQEALRLYATKAEHARSELESARREQAHIQVALSEASSAAIALAGQRKHLLEQIKEASAQMEEMRVQQEQAVIDLRLYERLKGVFGSEIRNVLFDSIRGSLEAHTAAWLRELANDLLKVTFPSQDAKNREKFDVLVQNGNAVQDVAAFSEGEGWRVSFAILLGIRQTLMQRTGCKLNLLLIDDPIGGLDNAGVSTFMQLLRDMGDRRLAKTILVALPRRELVDGASILTVIKEQGRSTCNSGHLTSDHL